MINKIQLDRLKLLREKWKGVDPSRVRMSAWRCGTLACAAGHAAMMPEFIEQGFTMEVACVGEVPRYADYVGMMACVEFFGVGGDVFGNIDASAYDDDEIDCTPSGIFEHELVMYRLNRFIEDCEKELTKKA